MEPHVVEKPRDTSRTWMLVLALLAATAAVVSWSPLPLEVVGVVGALCVTLAAAATGVRGGAFMAAVATALLAVDLGVVFAWSWGDFVVGVIAYATIGLGVGRGVDLLRSQRQRLADTVLHLEAVQSRLAQSEARYRQLFDASNDAVLVFGLGNDGWPSLNTEVNDRACRMLGRSLDELRNRSPLDLVPQEERRGVKEHVDVLARDGEALFETVFVSRAGHRVPVEISARLTEVAGRRVVLAIARDVSERKQFERRLEQLSLHDDLTGLLNRRGFYVMVEEARKRARRHGSRVLVLFGDLDGLKAVNDARGHSAGDQALVAVADALRATFRETDVVARLGGDEFAAVVETGLVDDREAMSVRLDAALAAAGRAHGVPVSVSFGMVTASADELADMDDVLRRADQAMYAVKRERRSLSGAAPRER